MKRRSLIALFGGAALVPPRMSVSQTAGVYRVGTLTVGPPLTVTSYNGSHLLAGLTKRGYTPGQNLIHEARGASGNLEQMAGLMQELKTANVGVVVTFGYPAAVVAKASGIATVIALGAGDPVATGLVASLARPGGNVTGISDDAALLTSKRLALLKEMSPRLRRVAMLWNKDDLGMSMRYQAAAKVAQMLGVTVQPLGVREPDDFNEAFTAMNREPPDAILMVSDSLTILNRKRVFDFAADRKLPAIYEADYFVRDGGLMSYGGDQSVQLDVAASLVDRIFRGAMPADLPCELPTRYLFVLNLKTAKVLEMDVPNSLLAQADELIE